MAKVTLCGPPLMELPFLDLRLTRTEAKALKTILGGISGSWGSLLEVARGAHDLREPIAAIWCGLDEAGL